MNQIQRFEFETHPVSIIEYQGQQVWLASEVERALDYGKAGSISNLIARRSTEFVEGVDYLKLVGAEARAVADAFPGSGNARKVTNILVLTEPGVFLVLMHSEAPKAVAFRRWVASVVLPALRRGNPVSGVDAATLARVASLEQNQAALASAIANLATVIRAITQPVPSSTSSLPASPPSGSVTASAIAATYGTTKGKVGACARRLRGTYGQCGTKAVGNSFPPGRATWWYSGIEAKAVADLLDLKPVANILTMFSGDRDQ